MECIDVMDLEDIRTSMVQSVQYYGRYLEGDNLPSPKYLALK